MTADDLDRMLADAVRVDPSPEFRARVRERVAGESVGFWPRLVPAATVLTMVAALVLAAVVGLDRVTSPTAIPQVADAGAPGIGVFDRDPIELKPLDTSNGQPLHRSPVSVARPRVEQPRRPSTEVLISASEQAGVRLLFETAASRRLTLPEDMLQDSSLPIVEARSAFPDPDWPWGTDTNGDTQ